ncbi:MAG: hypothetical protein H7318_12835 [Oligoflexus sp.]|nr:hypothetical protein [Oligoflexus sp.]
MKTLAVVLAVMSLNACATSQMVSSPGNQSSEFAPANEVSRPGVIKYVNQGSEWVANNSRKDAYEKMAGACGGKYKIDSEDAQTEGTVAQMIGGVSIVSPTLYWYIHFSCVK